MHPANSIRGAHKVARHRQRHLVDILHVDASRRETRDHSAFNHARGAMRGISIDADGRVFGKNRAIGRAQFGGKLRRQVNVHQPGHSEAAEQAAFALRPPDDARVNDRSGLDFFIGPDFDVGLDDRALLDNGVIANHRAFKHHRFAFDAGGRADDGPAQFRALADKRIVPHDAAINLRALIDNAILADGAGAVNDAARPDLAILRQVDGAIELRFRVDLHPFLTPDVAANILRRYFDIDAPLQGIRVGAHVLAEVAHIAPVAVRDVAVDGVALAQHIGE